MIYGSVCSGIEAATVAWHPLGWRAAFFSEIEAFPCAVLAHHYPTVPNHGDMTRFKEWPDANLDVLVGGTPCQSFSVAGLRKGLDDPRGNLTLVYLAIAARYRPRWLVWENVPGVLSDATGAFGAFLGGLGQLGYGFAYRILDAQHFGVPQRRRRVFVVGYLGDWRRAAAVLFERESLRGNPPARGEARQDVAGTLSSRASGGGGGPGAGTDEAAAGYLQPVGRWPADIAPTLNAHFGDKQGLEDQHALAGGGCSSLPQVALCLNAGAMGRQDSESETLIPVNGGGFDGPEIAPCLTQNYGKQPDNSDTSAGPMLVTAFDWQTGGDMRGIDQRPTAQLQRGQVPALAFADVYNGKIDGDVAATIGTRGSSQNASGPTLMQASAVRRLTPRECERLQGFPDDYTLIPRGKGMAKDGPRYKALGNSMAVPCMAWLGRRIAAVEQIELAPAAERAA